MTTTLFATVQAKPEFTGLVQAALISMLVPTRAEPSCVSYELYQSEEDAATFHLLESYTSDEALASHQQSPHFAGLLSGLTDKLASDIQIKRLGVLDVQPLKTATVL